MKKAEAVAKAESIVLHAGYSLEQLEQEMSAFVESVNRQINADSPEEEVQASEDAQKQAAALLTKTEDALAVRDKLAELYFALLARAKRIREAVQQAEVMARRDERSAESIRGSIEAWMLTSWNARKITGNYREFSIQKNPDKLVVIDETQIPKEFFDQGEPMLNKTRLSSYLKDKWAAYDAALKAGIQNVEEPYVPGAVLRRNGTRLSIK